MGADVEVNDSIEERACRLAAQLVRRGWTKGVYAKDAEAFIVSPTSPLAVCWCTVGALRRAFFELGYNDPLDDDLGLLRYKIGPKFKSIAGFPDLTVVDINDTVVSSGEEVALLLERTADALSGMARS